MKTKSNRNSKLKLLALVPIVGITLALNAETVTSVVYKNDEPQKQVPVKKGKKNTTVKAGDNKTIKVVQQDKSVPAEKVEIQETKPNMTAVKHQAEIDNEQLSQSDVFDKVDEVPQFPGGFAELMQYLHTNVRYPEDAKEAGAQGQVVVSFIVEKDGSISNAMVTKPTYPSLDEEALRVISAMPKWTPAKQNGETVRVKYSLPVSFRLKDKDLISEMSESTSFKDLTKRLPGAEIDENGQIFINGKAVKRIVFDGSDNPLATTITNIMLNDH